MLLFLVFFVAVLRESKLLLLLLLEAGPAGQWEDAVVDALGRRGEGGWVAQGGDGDCVAAGAGVGRGAALAEDGADFVADAEGALCALWGFGWVSALDLCSRRWVLPM